MLSPLAESLGIAVEWFSGWIPFLFCKQQWHSTEGLIVLLDSVWFSFLSLISVYRIIRHKLWEYHRRSSGLYVDCYH